MSRATAYPLPCSGCLVLSGCPVARPRLRTRAPSSTRLPPRPSAPTRARTTSSSTSVGPPGGAPGPPPARGPRRCLDRRRPAWRAAQACPAGSVRRRSVMPLSLAISCCNALSMRTASALGPFGADHRVAGSCPGDAVGRARRTPVTVAASAPGIGARPKPAPECDRAASCCSPPASRLVSAADLVFRVERRLDQLDCSPCRISRMSCSRRLHHAGVVILRGRSHERGEQLRVFCRVAVAKQPLVDALARRCAGIRWRRRLQACATAAKMSMPSRSSNV